MLDLPNITLVCIDTRPSIAYPAIEKTLKHCKFDSIKFFTTKNWISPNSDIEIIPWDNFSYETYSKFCITQLYSYIDTTHILLIQADGYIVNPAAWTEEFRKYDYIGATWGHKQNKVGNGGFSLRSKKLLETGSKLDLKTYNPEDLVICEIARKFFDDAGCIFAPIDIAEKFSVENKPYTGSFGFHDNNTWKFT